MEIITKQLGDIHTVVLKGRFDSMTAHSVEEKLNSMLESSHFKMIVDLTGVDYISSAGLRVLLSATKRARQEKDGDLRLASIQTQVRQVFDMAGFTQFYKVYDSEEKAVKSFT